MVPFVLAGMAIFAVTGVGLWIARDRLAANGHQGWLWICLAGFLWGFPGLATMIVHDRNRRIRQARQAEEAGV